MTTMDYLHALELAQFELDRIETEVGQPLELVIDKTVEADLGWVFFYNSAEFMRTKNFRRALAGNGPIVVRKDTGQVTCYGPTTKLHMLLEALSQ